MSEEVYQQLLKYINNNKGWKYVGNGQAMIYVKDLINYITCVRNNEV